MLLLCFPAYSQDESLTNGDTEQKSEKIEIHFDLNSCAIDSEYKTNSKNLSQLAESLERLQRDPLVTISQIQIDSYASPEGGRHYNERLTRGRTNSIYHYLTDTISVSDSLITKSYSGIDWDGLYTLVEESDMEYRDDVLQTLRSTPEETWRRVNPTDRWQTLVDSRNKHLMDLKYGRPYRYIAENLYTQLRVGSVVTIYFSRVATPIVVEEVTIASSIATQPIDRDLITALAPVVGTAADGDRKPLKFALKTNLLYYLLLAPNIEVEVPIKNRWSVAGEWLCPWWVTRDNGNALQVLAGQVEGRYWFGDRTNRPQLTGWFAGLYAGGGLYDLQWKDNGYQGEFYIAAGLAGGYAHAINKKKNLRLEYSLGLGYLNTDYRYYEGMESNEFLVWQHNGTYTWLGPTKAKVSLVWFVEWQRGGKR